MEILDDLRPEKVKPLHRQRSAAFLMYAIISLLVTGVLGYFQLEKYAVAYYLAMVTIAGVLIFSLIGFIFAIRSFIAKENALFWKTILLILNLSLFGFFLNTMINTYLLIKQMEIYNSYDVEEDQEVEVDYEDVEVPIHEE